MTFGELKRRLLMHRRLGGAGGMSVVNRALTRDQALDILDRAIESRKDEDRVTTRRDRMIANNVNRECGYGDL